MKNLIGILKIAGVILLIIGGVIASYYWMQMDYQVFHDKYPNATEQDWLWEILNNQR